MDDEVALSIEDVKKRVKSIVTRMDKESHLVTYYVTTLEGRELTVHYSTTYTLEGDRSGVTYDSLHVVLLRNSPAYEDKFFKDLFDKVNDIPSSDD